MYKLQREDLLNDQEIKKIIHILEEMILWVLDKPRAETPLVEMDGVPPKDR